MPEYECFSLGKKYNLMNPEKIKGPSIGAQ